MPPKRKIRNLPDVNDKEKVNQVNRMIFFLWNSKESFFKMSFFDPVYQNDNIQMNNDESDSELSINGLSQQAFRDKSQDESNETLDAVPRADSNNDTFDQDQSSDVIINQDFFIWKIFVFFALN